MPAPDRDAAQHALDGLLLANGDRVGVATSGGSDSLAALLLVSRACAGSGVPVFALHVDHGLRPGASQHEHALVERVARSLGAGFAARKVDVPATRARVGGSVEFVARTLRLAAVDDMAVDLDLTHVILAHHREDQIETVLLSILRGAWPSAICGMPSERRLPAGALLVRPFLRVPRGVLRAHSEGLEPAFDLMNVDDAHRRVAVRRHLLPLLRGASPIADEVILRIADAAREIDSIAAAAATEIARSPGVHVEPGVAFVPAGTLRSAGRFTRARFLRILCDADPAFGHVTWPLFHALEHAVASEKRTSAEVRRGVLLTARDGMLSLFTAVPRAPIESSFVWRGASACVAIDSVRSLRIESQASGVRADGPATAAALYVAPGAPIEIRRRRSSDRFRLGPQGTKLLSDELSDRKIQPVWRARIPLVFIGGELRWIAGIRAIRRPDDPPPNALLTIEGPAPWV